MNEKDTKFKVWKLCGEFNTHKQAVELNLEEDDFSKIEEVSEVEK